MEREVKLSWFYPYPVETVWRCLMEPELLKQWYLSRGDFKAEVGFRWMEVTKPKPKLNWDGKMYFEVLEVVPMQKLVHSFQGGPSEGVISLDTVVQWILKPKGNGTELTLIHSGFKGGRNYLVSFMMEMGWRQKVSKRLSNTLQSLQYAPR